MKLKDCLYGVLVKDKDNNSIGMIVGITNNCKCADQSERSKITNAIPLVQWSCGALYGIHPSNIEIYKE